MQSSSSSMLTKNSSSSEAQRRAPHPWTRVSWISGSDADSLDEEEVQEVESITLLGPSPAETAAATVAAAAASSSVVIAPTEEDTTGMQQQQQSSVTLKPFRFGSTTTTNSNNITGSSLLSPLVLNDRTATANESATTATTNPGSVSAPTSVKKQDNSEILVSQKGHLITPAVTDVVSEDDEASTAPPPTKRSWKSFWTTQQGSNEDNEEEDKQVKDIGQTVPAEEVNDQTCQAEPELKDDDIIVEEDDDNKEGEDMLSSRRLEAVKAMTTLQDIGKDCYAWVVDGLLMDLWAKLLSFGILLNTWFQNGINSIKSSYENISDKITTAYQEVSSTPLPTLSGISVNPTILFLVLFLLLVVVGFRLGSTSVAKRRPSPTNDLRDFVRYEKAHNVVDLKQIDDLNTEAFRTYARSTCVEAATFEQARAALDMGLYGVPDSIRSTIVPMAIMEGVTQKNSIQDSNNDFVQNGKADAFMAFWSTVYDPRGRTSASSSSSDDGETGDIMAYKTCVMVTGVGLTVAETVAEWTTKTEQYQIGTEPCHCGYVYCEECPVFDVREVKWPVFERRSLSLRKQEELRRWMVDQAVKSAEHLVLDGSDTNLALESSSGSSSSLVSRPFSAWTGSTSSAYFGEDSHNDRVVQHRSNAAATSTSSSSFGEEEL